MRERFGGLMTAGFLVVLAACASRGKKPEAELKLPAQRFELTGDTVHLYALVGEVRLERGDGNATVVEVTRVGTDAAQITVDTGRVGTQSTLQVRFPGVKVTTGLQPSGSTRISVADDGRFGSGVSGRTVEISRGGGGVRAQPNIVAKVPAGRTVLIDVGVGKVNLAGANANVRVAASNAEVQTDTVRGNVTLDVRSGTVRVSAVDGSLVINTSSAPTTVSQATGALVQIRSDTASVNGSGIQSAQLDVRTRSGAVLLTGIVSPVTRVNTDSGRVGVSMAGSADTVSILTRTGDAALSLVGGLRSLASLRSHSGDLTIRVTPSVSATILFEGELRSPTLEMTLADLQRANDTACTTSANDAATAPARCNLLRGRLGNGDGRIVAHSTQGDVRLAGF
ncbi:MAG TPA: DUF4097 family beta strand repeat-containing protein [Gemmatimonadaceae bacterium]|nr:DUF4097 family beta strand repeat-containing protein [Gemmatimonadaceae bacterium]